MADIGFFLFPLLHIVAAVSFVGTVALVIKLYFETDKGWYWLSLVLASLAFATAQWITVLFPIAPRGLLPLMSEAGDIAGSVLLAISFYGMHKTMKDIRKRVE
ncbi:Uncharacterised protein [uncultured archaeon]|nr:Uncharacterised protein [uncultured archaeon]